jgi:hypothetical protein
MLNGQDLENIDKKGIAFTIRLLYYESSEEHLVNNDVSCEL